MFNAYLTMNNNNLQSNANIFILDIIFLFYFYIDMNVRDFARSGVLFLKIKVQLFVLVYRLGSWCCKMLVKMESSKRWMQMCLDANKRCL